MDNMTHDEMRMIRREFINTALHIAPLWKLHHVKQYVRDLEIDYYKKELQAYK